MQFKCVFIKNQIVEIDLQTFTAFYPNNKLFLLQEKLSPKLVKAIPKWGWKLFQDRRNKICERRP